MIGHHRSLPLPPSFSSSSLVVCRCWLCRTESESESRSTNHPACQQRSAMCPRVWLAVLLLLLAPLLRLSNCELVLDTFEANNHDTYMTEHNANDFYGNDDSDSIDAQHRTDGSTHIHLQVPIYPFDRSGFGMPNYQVPLLVGTPPTVYHGHATSRAATTVRSNRLIDTACYWLQRAGVSHVDNNLRRHAIACARTVCPIQCTALLRPIDILYVPVALRMYDLADHTYASCTPAVATDTCSNADG
jgi:hypothetical protein